jgi:hypothetical protein
LVWRISIAIAEPGEALGGATSSLSFVSVQSYRFICLQASTTLVKTVLSHVGVKN